MLKQRNVVNTRMLASCFVWNCFVISFCVANCVLSVLNKENDDDDDDDATVKILRIRICQILHFNSLFVRFEHTSNVAAWYDNCVVDVTSPHA